MENPQLQLSPAFLALPNLGQPLEVRKIARWRLGARIAIIAVLLAAIPPAVVAARTAWLGEHGLWYAAAGMLFVFAALLAANAYSLATTTVVLYECGLAYGRRGDIRACRWEDIEAVTFEITRHSVNFVPTGTEYKYTLDLKSGERLKLTSDAVTRMGELGDTIREQVAPLIYERCAEAFRGGADIDFGPIRLNLHRGVQDRGEVYAWHDIEEIGLGGGQFIVRRKGTGRLKQTTIPLSAIPNVDVLMALIGETWQPPPS